ncbi:single-strand DNA binding protein [Vibrio phage LP.2]|nr:single-strand DNA binding protein [Vibrio phage LP.2]
MERSESIKHLAAALNKAQAEMSGAKKGKQNPFFKSSYADLNAVVDAVRIPFAENGLSYSQFPVMDDNRVGVETILMHESGEFIASTLMLPTGKLDAQAAGSAITYARRYSLQAIAGIPAEDDDGNAAVTGQQRQQQKPAQLKSQQPEFDGQEFLMRWTHIAQSCQALNALDQQKEKVLNAAWKQLNQQQRKAAKEVYDAVKEDLEIKGA